MGRPARSRQSTFGAVRRSPRRAAALGHDYSDMDPMKKHSAYSPSDWLLDQSTPLDCPDCGSSRDYGPRCAPRAAGAHRLYRACKDCGFWQEADGAPPYRCWKSEHVCTRRVHADYSCPFCGQVLIGSAEGKDASHRCGKYLLPSEDGYDCTTCGTWQGRETTAPWTLPGSG